MINLIGSYFFSSLLNDFLMKPILYKDKYGNSYIYSFSRKKLCYLNNVVFEFVKLYLSGYNLDYILEKVSFKYPIHEFNRAKDQFLFFLENSFLSDTNAHELSLLTSDCIRKSVSNVNVITFEVTQKCNLKCYYCTYGELYNNTENNHDRDLLFNKAKGLMDYMLVNYNSKDNLSTSRFLTIGFYGGEPLLNFRFIKKMVNYLNEIKTNNVRIEYTMTTNALLLDKYMDFLVDNNFMIMISLDGDCKSSLYRVSEKGSRVYNKILFNIKELKRKYPEYFKNKVVFNTVLHDKNSLLDVLKFMKFNFNKTPKLSELSQVSLLSSKRYVYDKMKIDLIEELSKSKDFIDKKDYLILDPRIDSLKKKISLLVSNNYSNLGELLDVIDTSLYLPTISCTPFSFKLFVSADSNIHLCEKIGYKYPLGYIDENNIPQFDFDLLAINYNNYYNAIADECLNCYNIYTCLTCLFERNFKCKRFLKEDYSRQLEYYTNFLMDISNI